MFIHLHTKDDFIWGKCLCHQKDRKSLFHLNWIFLGMMENSIYTMIFSEKNRSDVGRLGDRVTGGFHGPTDHIHRHPTYIGPQLSSPPGIYTFV